MKIIRKLALLGLACLPLPGITAEFVVINQTLSWTMTSLSGFYFFQVPVSAPTNWLSPDDYYNGQFYTRYEVISIATGEPFGIQFGIWQQQSGYVSETMESLRRIYTGAGTVITNNSSPSAWWRNYSGVDFARVSDFNRLGIVLWCLDPQIFIAPVSWDGNADVWNTRNRWFPCSIKVTVVAVSAGSTFSGWENYGGGGTPTKYPTPTYSVDYTNELTNKVVPSTDEYSYSSTMSGAVSGTGVKLTLTPGTDVYFRTKASGSILASDIQHLDVPSRPAAPSYTIDYINAQTGQVVPATVEYSTSSGFTGVVAGTGVKVNLTPGQDLYFRVKATSSSFRSTAFFLDVPSQAAAPAITINYSAETTSAIASTMEYSTSAAMTSAVTGSNAAVSVTPGTDLYIRYKATASTFSSVIQTLDVPARPATPSFGIDYVNEETDATVTSAFEYAYAADMTGSVTGSGTYLKLTPGTDVFFRKPATPASFRSLIQSLDVPSRPAAPSFAIDFPGEKTSTVVTSVVEYAYNSAMTGSVTGSGSYLSLTPGTDVYFRKPATSGSFLSPIQTLDVPVRPAGPAYTIDFAGETTAEVVTNAFEYADNPAMTSSQTGSGAVMPLEPGFTWYFRRKATTTQFASGIQELVVPQRLATPAFTIDYEKETTSTAVTAAFEYDTDSAMSSANTGTGVPVSLEPGSTWFFRQMATTEKFRSDVQRLTVPLRPAAPVYTVDYIGEQTTETVSSTTEYAADSVMTEASSGADEPLALLPGTDYYFRLKYTDTSYVSPASHLVVPERPLIIAAVGDTVTNDFFPATVSFPFEVTGFDADDIEAVNAAVSMTGDRAFRVEPTAQGEVTLTVKANAVDEGNFTSEPFITWYKDLSLSIPDALASDVSMLVYPNPVTDRLTVQTDLLLLPVEITLYDGNGIALARTEMQTATFTLDMQGLVPGLYILKAIGAGGNVNIRKVFKQ